MGCVSRHARRFPAANRRQNGGREFVADDLGNLRLCFVNVRIYNLNRLVEYCVEVLFCFGQRLGMGSVRRKRANSCLRQGKVNSHLTVLGNVDDLHVSSTLRAKYT